MMSQHRLWWILWLFGFVGFLGYVPGLPTELRLLNLCFMIPLIRNLIKRRTSPVQYEEVPARPEEPLPPSAGGAALFITRYIMATLFCFLIPPQLIQIIRHSAGQTRADKRGFTSTAAYQQKVRYRLPFDGTWYVTNGGITPKTSHSWDIVGQRFAYDFVMTDETLRRWRTNGKHVEDYLCYNLPILAPADGEIVDVVEGVRDAPGVGTGWLDVFTRHFPGNAVMIRHANEEYSFLAHLIPGSISVRVGQTVKQGQIIGYCGNSGHSTEPHLHFHVQDHPNFFQGAGLPVAFDHVSVNGTQTQDSIYLLRGTQVQHSSKGHSPGLQV